MSKRPNADSWRAQTKTNIHRLFDASRFDRVRITLPYGLWTCPDGREVLFNRDYAPIWERLPGEPARRADPNERIPWADQVWFYNDGCPPHREWEKGCEAWFRARCKEARVRCSRALTDFLC